MTPLPPRLGRGARAGAALLVAAATAVASCALPATRAAGPAPAAVDAVTGVAAPGPPSEPLPEPEVALPEITALAVARLVLAEQARRLDEDSRESVARVLADGEQSHGIGVLLALALITQESRFDPKAVGPRGSLGLMQLRPFVGADVAQRYGLPWAGDGTLHDPAHNVRLGLLYFREMLQMFEGDVELALAAYNMGPYRLKRLLRREDAATLRYRYSERVREHYDALAQRYRPEFASGWGG